MFPYMSSLQNGQYFWICLWTHLSRMVQKMAPKIEKMAIIQKWLNLQHRVTLMTPPISGILRGVMKLKLCSKVNCFWIELFFEPFVASEFASKFKNIDHFVVRTYRATYGKTLSTVVSIQATVDFLNSLLNFFVILQFQLMKTNWATDCVVTLVYNDSSENI